MRFWLKDGAENDSRLPKKVQVQTCDDSGEKYVDFGCSCIVDPTEKWPAIPEELIKSVTAKQNVKHHLRTEGLYRDGGAVLVIAETTHLFDDNGVEYFSEQQFMISAPNLAALQAIYSKVRQGKLKPAEDWEAVHLSEAELKELEELDLSDLEERLKSK